MRLYLSSFRTGDHPEELLALLDVAGEGARVAVVANAVDAAPPPSRQAAVELELDALTGLGLDPVELDLRRHFDRPPESVATELDGFPMVWVRGGNVFVLRHALSRSGADRVLAELLARDALVYAGYSAGACVLAPDLHGLELCDDPDEVRAAYGAAAQWDGLGLLDFRVVPHVDSPGHPETELVADVAELYRARGLPHRTLRDGQALVVRDATTRLV